MLEMRDGLMKGIPREAARRSPFPYVVLIDIDEIDRANFQSFGEVLTVIELDKRGHEAQAPGQWRIDQHPPKTLFLLGTMNTADKSIRSLDSALRRRFAFIELMPDPSVLEGGWSTASIFRFC